MRKLMALLAGLTLVFGFGASSVRAQTYTVLFTFDVQDGQGPIDGIAQDSAGNLYGTTYFGGTYTDGVVYKLDKSENETVLYNFGTNAAFPASSVIFDSAGNLYGSTQGGVTGSVVYRLNRKNQEKILYEFHACGGDGCYNPNLTAGNLLRDAAGNLYGTTIFGGVKGKTLFCESNGCGIVFSLDTAGKLHALHAFTGAKDGAEPYSPLVLDGNGNLYGIAFYGGDTSCPQSVDGCGTVFKVTASGKLTVLHTFTGGKDGAFPSPGLLLDSAGNLYGASQSGGLAGCGFFSAGCGTLFKISASGAFEVLYTFQDGADGTTPNGSLVQDADGNLYGTTALGDKLATFYGVVFKLSTHGKLALLHTLNGSSDGGYPSSLMRDSAGNLYGTAYTSAGFNPGGAVFMVSF